MEQTLSGRFKDGQEVYAKQHPHQALVIRRYVDRIYYCTVLDDAAHKELVYFERELMEPSPADAG